MTDVTAQAFREAAAQAQRFNYPAWATLLLAAAEQREQLDRVNAERNDDGEWRAVVEGLLTQLWVSLQNDPETEDWEEPMQVIGKARRTLDEQREALDQTAANRDGLKRLCDEHYAAQQEAEGRAGRLLQMYEQQQDRIVEVENQIITLTAENAQLWEIRATITNDARAEVDRLTAERDEALSRIAAARQAWADYRSARSAQRAQKALVALTAALDATTRPA